MVSPSILGLTAIIISLILLLFILLINESIFISLGLIPSKGDIKPSKTWYTPLNVPTFSMILHF